MSVEYRPPDIGFKKEHSSPGVRVYNCYGSVPAEARLATTSELAADANRRFLRLIFRAQPSRIIVRSSLTFACQGARLALLL